MSTQICECGEKIHRSAKVCQHCGNRDVNFGFRMIKAAVWILIIFSIILFAC